MTVISADCNHDPLQVFGCAALADARHNQLVQRWLAEQEARTS
ncbi:hypothetical protein PV755_09710 [Streptomyces caniscabiei]|nr:hypothetical protein [Streptomyces caniscabiei]MDX3509198.1 hypothetical protein [Streptomyces caniscabiei]MDX3717049.1 hypothetical protein [Streptomyces caniscabiei]